MRKFKSWGHIARWQQRYYHYLVWVGRVSAILLLISIILTGLQLLPFGVWITLALAIVQIIATIFQLLPKITPEQKQSFELRRGIDREMKKHKSRRFRWRKE
jgi:uncharacterized membrane protein